MTYRYLLGRKLGPCPIEHDDYTVIQTLRQTEIENI